MHLRFAKFLLPLLLFLCAIAYAEEDFAPKGLDLSASGGVYDEKLAGSFTVFGLMEAGPVNTPHIRTEINFLQTTLIDGRYPSDETVVYIAGWLALGIVAYPFTHSQSQEENFNLLSYAGYLFCGRTYFGLTDDNRFGVVEGHHLISWLGWGDFSKTEMGYVEDLGLRLSFQGTYFDIYGSMMLTNKDFSLGAFIRLGFAGNG